MIPLGKAITLADYYGVSLDYLAGRSRSRLAAQALSPEQISIAQQYAQLTEKNKGKLELFLEQLLQNQ